MATALNVSSDVEHFMQHGRFTIGQRFDHKGLHQVQSKTDEDIFCSNCCTIAIYCAM